jgi:serine/threonine protein kinase
MAYDTIGDFQVFSTLGKGAHSTLLHIRRSEDSTQYALKVVPISGKNDQRFLDQARHEFRVAGLLDHPNLVKIYALEEQKDWLRRVRKVQLLIEYVNGETLDKIKGLSMARLVQVFEKVAQAMIHMHRRGIYHADLKPGNIMLSRVGEVKVIDYGLAWIKSEPKGRVQGTPEYMAPEQVRRLIVNERTDIYNFGATMYRLVTWQHPPLTITSTGGMKLNAKTHASMLQPVARLNSNAPTELCDLIERCLSFKADGRPQRMSELQGALDHIVDALVKKPEDRLENMEW